MNGSINYGTSTTQQKKKEPTIDTTWMNLQRTMLSEKNANTQRLCTVQSHLRNTVEMTEL